MTNSIRDSARRADGFDPVTFDPMFKPNGAPQAPRSACPRAFR
ncbi:hypothetical protein LC55x_4182 [Lysobacter capsici]|nr:hypothetical protein LC55x_4182 [Lysobacter capsici]